jgi:hypothetical protein
VVAEVEVGKAVVVEQVDIAQQSEHQAVAVRLNLPFLLQLRHTQSQ